VELSVLFENHADRRNLGGLVRNANAYLADLFYVGRRKINRQGTVGSDHYTGVHYLGPSLDARAADVLADEDARRLTEPHWNTGFTELLRARAAAAGPSGRTVGNVVGFEPEANAPPCELWLLDCEQTSLFAPEAAARYERWLKARNVPSVHLDDDASVLAAVRDVRATAARTGSSGRIVLAVPPEGEPLSDDVMYRCVRRVRVLTPRSGLTNDAHRGLPSQVASAIALQRLFAPLHVPLTALS
jgi:hypothetical protein